MRFAVFGLLVFARMAIAGEPTLSQVTPVSPTVSLDPNWTVELLSSYDSSARIMKAGSFGSQAGVSYELQLYKDIKLYQNYYLQLGFDLEHYDFSRSSSTFPYALNSLAGEIRFSYWDGEDFYPVIQLEPGLYYTRDYITKNSFDIPIRLTPGFKIRDNLYVIAGCSIDTYSNPIVFPVAGFNWVINDQWNLRAVFPRPRLSYSPTKKIELFVQADIDGGSFRNGPTTDHRTNNAILEYFWYRAGVGINFNLRKGVSIEAIAGWDFSREFDYIRAGPIYNVKGAPYVSVHLTMTLF